MAVGVIHRFEPIEVDIAKRQLGACTRRRLDGLRRLLVEQLAIGQPRQHIVTGVEILLLTLRIDFPNQAVAFDGVAQHTQQGGSVVLILEQVLLRS